MSIKRDFRPSCFHTQPAAVRGSCEQRSWSLPPVDPLGLVLPVRVLERILVLERGPGGVDAAAVGAVLPLLLEAAGKVTAAELRVPGAVPHVVTAAEADDVDVASLVEGLESLDGAVAAVGAGDDDPRVLVRELRLHLIEERAVGLLVLHHLLASLGIVAVLGVDDGDVVEPVCAAMLGGGRLVSGEVADRLELIRAANVEDVVSVVGEEAASLLPVGDALVGVLGADLLDVLDVVREVEGGASLDVDAALGALGLSDEGRAGGRDGLGGTEGRALGRYVRGNDGGHRKCGADACVCVCVR
mmetsp:Transcript_97/g.349  ORF Transcript_97/g.349 Transcript_97/m.349 type:complete len:301 (-) Transcript_97:11-913(-)